MPAFLIQPGDVVKALTICQVPGQVSINARQYQLVQSSQSGELTSTNFLAAFAPQMHSYLVPLMAQEATYYGNMLYLDTPHATPGWRPDSRGAERSVGTGGVGLLPHQTSGLISLYTNTIGKKGQGRIYVPFPPQITNGADGNPTAQYVTKLDELGMFLAGSIMVTVGAVTHMFLPVLYKKGGVPYQINTYQSRSGWATQRRRGNFGPTNELPF